MVKVNTLYDFTWKSLDIFLFGALLVFVALFMSLFFKKRWVLIGAVLLVLFGTVFLINYMKITTFPELVSDRLHKDSTVESITVTVNDLSGRYPERSAQVTLEDEALIGGILKDFSKMELKRDEDARGGMRKYTVTLFVTNEIEKGQFLTKSIKLDVDEDYLNQYDIIGKSDHLKTIEALTGNEEIDWTYFDG